MNKREFSVLDREALIKVAVSQEERITELEVALEQLRADLRDAMGVNRARIARETVE